MDVRIKWDGGNERVLKIETPCKFGVWICLYRGSEKRWWLRVACWGGRWLQGRSQWGQVTQAAEDARCRDGASEGRSHRLLKMLLHQSVMDYRERLQCLHILSCWRNVRLPSPSKRTGYLEGCYFTLLGDSKYLHESERSYSSTVLNFKKNLNHNKTHISQSDRTHTHYKTETKFWCVIHLEIFCFLLFCHLRPMLIVTQ